MERKRDHVRGERPESPSPMLPEKYYLLLDRECDDTAKRRVQAVFSILALAAEIDAACAAELAKCDLSESRLIILLKIAESEEGSRIGDLARLLGVEAATATVLVTRLERAGLVTKTRSDIDTRVVFVRATGAGRALVAEVSRTHSAWIRRISAQINDQETESLLAFFRRIYVGLKG